MNKVVVKVKVNLFFRFPHVTFVIVELYFQHCFIAQNNNHFHCIIILVLDIGTVFSILCPGLGRETLTVLLLSYRKEKTKTYIWAFNLPSYSSHLFPRQMALYSIPFLPSFSSMIHDSRVICMRGGSVSKINVPKLHNNNNRK